MADINKLKDKIKSTIYPNGKGAINASDHQAMLLDMADGMAETDTKLTELSGEVAYTQGIKIPIYDSGAYQRMSFGFDIKAGSTLSEINISSDDGIYLSPSSGADDFFVQKIELPYTLLEDIKGLRTRKAVDNGSLVFNGVINNIQEEISKLESQISTLETGVSGLEELKADVATIAPFVAKESSVEESTNVDVDWVIGVTNSLTGKYNSANTTYITTENPIAVNPADKLDFFRSDGGHIGVAGDIVFFSNNTYHSVSEKNTFPVIIPDGINGVKVNIFKDYLESGAYAKITRLSKSYTPKLATSIESGLMSASDKSKLDNIDRVEIPELATPTDSGLMSASDKQKLDSIVLPIPTPVIEGSGMYKNASAYGVLPNNDGNTNADNYQAAVSGGGTIVIDIPGTYEFSKTIKIPSNTTLLFGSNVYIKRVAGANGRVVGGYSFINENAYTGIYDSNIKIIGLNLIANGQDAGTTIQGLRSMLGFMHIKNLVVDGFQMRDGADEGKLIQNNYGIQVVDFQNISLTNIYIESYKDGIHLGIGKDFTIRDCKFRTHDDPIAINAMDYVASNAALGTIENGIIDNVHDLDFSGETEFRGRSILIYTGSWSDWKAGESYQYGDTVVSNGKIYRALSPARGAEAIVAVNPPTHDSGSVTTAEGIEWLMYQDFKVGYRADVKNVTISNLFVSQKRVAILSCDAANGSWNRATLSDEISSIDNIILDKVYDLNGSDYAVMIYQDAELFRVSNSYFKNAGIQVNGFTSKTYKPAVISLVNNYFGLNTGVVLNYSSSRIVKAKTSNTIVNGTLYFNDKVEVLDNL